MREQSRWDRAGKRATEESGWERKGRGRGERDPEEPYRLCASVSMTREM